MVKLRDFAKWICGDLIQGWSVLKSGGGMRKDDWPLSLYKATVVPFILSHPKH